MNNRKPYIIITFFVLVAFIFLSRTFYFQVGTDKYKTKAESMLSKNETIPAYRGLIYDRNHKLLVYNKPVYQVEAIPKNINQHNIININ